MWAKICANTNLEDALAAVAAGADAVGFVFAPSSRRVNVKQAAGIVRALPENVEKVGVFASIDPREIAHHVANVGLTAVQLHSRFHKATVEMVSSMVGPEVKIIQTLAYAVDAVDRAVVDADFVAALEASLAEPLVWAVLIDAARSGTSGGLGITFDWRHVGGLAREAALENGKKTTQPRVVLAGGLRQENVCEAIADFEPWGVDVASGVEVSTGKKDHARVKQFIELAKTARP